MVSAITMTLEALKCMLVIRRPQARSSPGNGWARGLKMIRRLPLSIRLMLTAVSSVVTGPWFLSGVTTVMPTTSFSSVAIMSIVMNAGMTFYFYDELSY